MDMLTIFLIGFVGAITPGPDILLVMHNTLKFGIWQAIKVLSGIATGWIVFLSIIYLGFTHLFNTNFMQLSLTVLGGFYLLFLAYQLLKNNISNQHSSLDSDFTQEHRHAATQPDTYVKGLIINLSNPKAILFFSTIIAPFIEKNLEISLIVLYLSLVSGFLSIIFTTAYFRKYLTVKLFSRIDIICGILFLLFAFSLFYHAFNIVMKM
ncbi:LysE family translocator [Helicobacter aurati]|uniref:LysE family translocator n=1 Tax=Helicobacter aurati TaxID=137778 RepID=A0A3D8J1S8_9HELI|nr:LysE family translocator [Helicobacter aurati]RDU70721.1 LysE family translocator [Helicobacter aurati]